jgi:hypothetical protein
LIQRTNALCEAKTKQINEALTMIDNAWSSLNNYAEALDRGADAIQQQAEIYSKLEASLVEATEEWS